MQNKMKKTLTFITAFICIYTYSQTNPQIALDIDFNKDIESYNYSINELDKIEEHYVIDLHKLEPEKNHFLAKFKFNGERVFFNNDGVFNFILLQKEYLSKKDLEKELIEIDYVINQKYGISLMKNKE